MPCKKCAADSVCAMPQIQRCAKYWLHGEPLGCAACEIKYLTGKRSSVNGYQINRTRFRVPFGRGKSFVPFLFSSLSSISFLFSGCFVFFLFCLIYYLLIIGFDGAV